VLWFEIRGNERSLLEVMLMSMLSCPRVVRSTSQFSLVAFMLVGALALSARAQTFTVLHTFTGAQDGQTPYAGLTLDQGGNLYGTTSQYYQLGGTAFQLKRHNGAWIFNPLAYIGRIPEGRLVFGTGGALYGTTVYGGSGFCTEFGCGTVYSVFPSQTICHSVSCPWTVVVDYSFNGPDGNQPGLVDPVFDSAGNLYGTTTEGGANFIGNVFELTRVGGRWTGTSLHDLTVSEGEYPQSRVLLDAQGNIYATASGGGPNGRGSVFELTRSGSGWTFNLVYGFPNSADGNGPVGGLISDQTGNLYGSTFSGGANGGGTVFELSPSGGGWNFSVIYSFTGQGYNPGPLDTLTMDAAGNLYGTTFLDGAFGCGSVFKLTRNNGNWSYSDLHDFTCGSDGAMPSGGVSIDASGNLFGTASAGGNGFCQAGGCGVVWEITAQ
jgi:uncharacterized repeat protein (TIGR03803 family)